MDELDLGATIKGFSPGQKVFNRYTLKKILGRGGMGVVWLARDEELDRDVAMKFLPEIVALDPEAVADLKRETRRNLDLTHPHIVRIHDFVADSRAAAISMEYIDGASLSALKLQKPGRIFTVAELSPWISQLCTALTYAHTEAQVVHRDLKPANLMIDARGRLKITDFGIARGISDSVSRVSAQAGSSAGTPLYMSPQQMLGEKPSVADDIYALGATLYELLTGKPPFHSGNVPLQVQTKAPPAIAARRRELDVTGQAVPAAWEETIAACLAKEAKDRPAGMEELWQRLSGRPVTGGAAPIRPAAVTSQPAPEAARPAKSRTPLIGAVAAGVILLGAAGWYFGVHQPEQERLEEQGRAAAVLKLKTEQELAATVLQASARGGIIVRSNLPGAEVTVGALEHGLAPLTLKEVKLGKYVVKARLAGHEDWTGEVEVKENDFAEITAELVRWSGQLTMSAAVDGGEVTLRALDGGGAARNVQLPAKLTLPVGRYEITFRSKDWLDLTRQVEIKRNQSLSVEEAYTSARRAPEWYSRVGPGELRQAAEAGDLEARVRLGDRHLLGLDGRVNAKRAYEEYQMAFAAKYPPVYRRLNQLLGGYLVTRLPFEQTELMLREGVAAGDACAIVGWHQRLQTPSGLKAPKPVIAEAELSKAVRRIEELAGQGDLFAMSHLAVCFALGTGVAKDEVTARRWRKEGAERGSVRGMLGYANMLLVEKNTSEALAWLTKAADRGDDAALVRLAELYRNGDQVAVDKAKAFEFARQAASHDYYHAMGIMAGSYQRGDGVLANLAEALHWREKAAESGVPFYMNALADTLMNGVITPKNTTRAIQLYRQSAEWNDAAACFKLGSLYAAGVDVAKDEAAAIQWYRKAADKEDAGAMTALGVAYATGVGVAKDQVVANEWYRKAAEKGEPTAIKNLGAVYANGLGVVKDEAAATEWYRKGAEKGDAEAMTHLGVRYALGRGVAKNQVVANDWYRKAAAQGEPRAMFNLGLSYANAQGVAKDEAMAIEWYRKAAEKGQAAAMNSLGIMYEMSQGVPKDQATANEWYRKAAEKGNSNAMHNIGLAYAYGRGVTQDEAAAIEWYRKAARAGNTAAQEALKKRNLTW